MSYLSKPDFPLYLKYRNKRSKFYVVRTKVDLVFPWQRVWAWEWSGNLEPFLFHAWALRADAWRLSVPCDTAQQWILPTFCVSGCHGCLTPVHSLKLGSNNLRCSCLSWTPSPSPTCALYSAVPLLLLLFPNSFIHSLSSYFLRDSCVLGISIGAGDTGADRIDLFPDCTI